MPVIPKTPNRASLVSVIAGIYFSQTSVIYFCRGFSCCPYYWGVRNSEVSTRRVMNPSAISRMFELDFMEHKNKSQYGLSKEDRKFLDIAEQGIHQCEDGHYELPRPLKNENLELPNNRIAAFRRLSQLKSCIKRRFESKNGRKYYDDYVEFMKKLIDSGYAERVPETSNSKLPSSNDAESKRNVWYIPHHGVYHPKKPNKIRVVFDCAAEYESESLNKYLLQGPDLTNNLTGVLCRFRQEPTAFICDIEAMFHQVRVDENHRDLLPFFWWEDGDLTKKPKEYRMTVHLFGATSSPGCANFALKSTQMISRKSLVLLPQISFVMTSMWTMA